MAEISRFDVLLLILNVKYGMLVESDGRVYLCAEQASSKETAECGGAAAAPSAREETEDFLQSKDVTCGICMDKVYEKMNPDEQRFGILPNCNHSFCLKCIVTWRKTKDLREEVIK